MSNNSTSTDSSKSTIGSSKVSANSYLPSLKEALRNHTVTAQVVDVDHFTKGMMTVDTDYIIEIKRPGQDKQNTFMISKTYHQFRSLCNKLKEASELATAGIKEPRDFTKSAKFVVKFVDAFCQIVESEPKERLAKVSYTYVKKLSAERSRRLNDALKVLLENFPDGNQDGQMITVPGIAQLVKQIEKFLLTDHVVEEGKDSTAKSKSTDTDKINKNSDNTTLKASDAVKLRVQTEDTENTTQQPPNSISMKARRSVLERQMDAKRLEKLSRSDSGLVMEEKDLNLSSKLKSPKEPQRFFVNYAPNRERSSFSIWVVMPILLALLFVLVQARQTIVHVDADYALLICFMCYVLGYQVSSKLHAGNARPNYVSNNLQSPTVQFKEPELKVKEDSVRSLALLRKSMSTLGSTRFGLPVTPESHKESDFGDQTEVLHHDTIPEQPRALTQSPLKIFPKNGDPEKDLNCVSEAPCNDFPVRGGNYLVDHKKIPSGPMLFPWRGADLLLTDECPENVGRSSAILGGKLREKPTFLINFRLPWGILVLYYEIPEKFLPYVKKRYDSSWADKNVPPIDQMSPAERCAARFLMGDDEHKNASLKILPKVVIGPWIVKSVVGTKPAIIGNKLPINYVYQPQEGKDKQLYLEADLDIVASSAARKILSVVRSYTQGLTLDLGFLVEGKQPDELPEQMLVGTRLHGLDPLNASLLPPMPHDVLNHDDDHSVSSNGTNRS